MASVPFDSRDGVIWFDGEFVDWKDAKVHVLTHGLHYASAVFEGERAYGGEIFKSRQHAERLIESGRILGFTIPYSAEEIIAAKDETLKRMGFKDAYVRPIAWRGSEMMGVSAQHNTIHLAIAVWSGRATSSRRSASRASASTSPSIAARIRRRPPAGPRPPAST